MVYVDPLLKRRPTRMFPHSASCTLFADTEIELHQFTAGAADVPTRHFHRAGRFAFYQLNPKKRDWCIRNGAKPLSREDAVKRMSDLGYDGPREKLRK